MGYSERNVPKVRPLRRVCPVQDFREHDPSDSGAFWRVGPRAEVPRSKTQRGGDGPSDTEGPRRVDPAQG